MRRLKAGGLAIALGLLGGCAPDWGVEVGPVRAQNPLVTRLEIAPNPQSPNGPFEILATASGQGTLAFTWQTNGGLLSVATERIPLASASVAQSYTAYQPPSLWGEYRVYVTVSDSGGGTTQGVARFMVDQRGCRAIWPAPALVPPPDVAFF